MDTEKMHKLSEMVEEELNGYSFYMEMADEFEACGEYEKAGILCAIAMDEHAHHEILSKIV